MAMHFQKLWFQWDHALLVVAWFSRSTSSQFLPLEALLLWIAALLCLYYPLVRLQCTGFYQRENQWDKSSKFLGEIALQESQSAGTARARRGQGELDCLKMITVFPASGFSFDTDAKNTRTECGIIHLALSFQTPEQNESLICNPFWFVINFV